MAFENTFTWSKSRDNLFKECRRAYYLHHYGAWGGWDRSAADAVRELYIMKNLQTRATWIGSAVHDVAERAVKAIRDGRPQDPEDVLKRMEKRLRRDLADSEAGRFRDSPKRHLGLQAHYYAVDGDSDDWDDAVQQGLSSARIFFEGRAYRRVQALGGDAILSVEELESFEVDGVKVWVKLDLAMRGKDGKIVIVDWKTGKHHVSDDVALQLGIYGLYGVQTWGVQVEDIIAFDVNLRDEEVLSTHPVDAAVLDKVRAYIEGSINEMRAVLDDVPTNVASMGRFPQTEELWKCRRCRFRKACDREDV